MPIPEQKAQAAQGAKEENQQTRRAAEQTQQQSGANSAAGGKRTMQMPVGVYGAQVPQDKIEEVERTVPADEPPPLPPNSELKVIGKRIARLDGPLKVSGKAKYTSDIRLPGMLWAKCVIAETPHARIKSIDTSAAEKAPGVKAVHILEHVDGSAQLKDPSQELPSKYPIIRYAGQPIAAVAATTQLQANDAAKLVKIDWEELPWVVDLEKAIQPDAALVYPGPAAAGGSAGGGGGAQGVQQKGNVRGPNIGPRGKGVGDVEAGFKQADVVVEQKYVTQVQTHSALETHGVVADFRPEKLTVWASTQGTSSVRDEMAEVFDLKKSQVRVITEFMGGGFGAKFGAGNEGVLAAHLSKKAGAPVRLMYDRKQEHLSAGNRPNSRQELKVGATKDGKLVAMHLVQYGTGGTGTGAGSAGPVQNMYDCPNVLTLEHDVFTNAGPAASMRAPGHPQGCFALEQTMDMLAEKLGMDPLQLRDLNDSHPARREERRIGAELVKWGERRRKPASDSGPIKRGIGFAQSVWYRINNMDSKCEVRIGRDGSVELYSAVQDIGGGIRTALAQIVAEELGLQPKDIQIHIGDTNSPIGPPSGGSMTTGSITPAARNAAWKAKQILLAQVAPAMGAHPDELVMSDGKVSKKGGTGTALTFKQAAAKLKTEEVSALGERQPDYARTASRVTYGGVQFAEVAVDSETGVIRVEKVTAVHDCGRPINTLALESQINGGVIQGISYALFENRILDRNTGFMVNPNLEQYKIASAREVPKIDVHLVEQYLGQSSTDAGGIGEPSTVPTSAAIANAVYNALGVRITKLPMTPKVVIEAMQAARKSGARA